MQSTDDETIGKAGMFYASCIDQHANGPVNTLFLSRFRDLFSNVKDAKSFTKLMAPLSLLSSTTLFNMNIGLDDKNPMQYAIFMRRVTLGLPHRDNYLDGSDHNVEMRRQYLNFIESMLDLAGRAKLIPRQDHVILAKDILEFETRIANFSLSNEHLRDPDVIYNKRFITDMPSTLFFFDYFKELGVDVKKVNESVIIDHPAFFDSIALIMSELDKDHKTRSIALAFLAFHAAALSTRLGLLGESAFGELFKFRQFLYGLKKMREKWKNCQELTNLLLGDAVGKAFVETHFKDAQMNKAKTLSERIMKSFSENFETLDWMDESTRKSAQSKLKAINRKVGYSSKLDSYDEVKIQRTNLSNNVVACIMHAWKRSFSWLGKPRDNSQWLTKPYAVEAHYSFIRNEIVLPAGILQPPFFSDAYPDAMNFGSIGTVLGHENYHMALIRLDENMTKMENYDRGGLIHVQKNMKIE